MAEADSLDQTDIDALWLAARVAIDIGDVPRNLRQRAQLRLQRLADAEAIEMVVGKAPMLAARQED